MLIKSVDSTDELHLDWGLIAFPAVLQADLKASFFFGLIWKRENVGNKTSGEEWREIQDNLLDMPAFEIHLVHLWKVYAKTAPEWKYQLLYYVQIWIAEDKIKNSTVLSSINIWTDAKQPRYKTQWSQLMRTPDEDQQIMTNVIDDKSQETWKLI